MKIILPREDNTNTALSAGVPELDIGLATILPAGPEVTIQDVKERIYRETGIAVQQQALVLEDGTVLPNPASCASFGLTDNSVVRLMVLKENQTGPHPFQVAADHEQCTHNESIN